MRTGHDESLRGSTDELCELSRKSQPLFILPSKRVQLLPSAQRLLSTFNIIRDVRFGASNRQT